MTGNVENDGSPGSDEMFEYLAGEAAFHEFREDGTLGESHDDIANRTTNASDWTVVKRRRSRKSCPIKDISDPTQRFLKGNFHKVGVPIPVDLFGCFDEDID